jgi:MFS family permease
LSTTRVKNLGTVGYSDLVRGNANFRYLWFGQIVSLLGDWFNLIASATLVATLTESGVAVGGLFVVRMLAPFLVSPFAGVAADRYNRKHILILTDLGRALTLLGFLFVREPGQVWLLYLLTAIQLAMSGFFFPTRTAILPDIVSKGELGAANALSGATWSVMLAFGAAIGGIVAGRFGAYPAFAIDSMTYLASAALIFRISYHHKPELDSPDKSIVKALKQYVDGLRYLWQHSDFLVIAFHKAAFALTLGGAFQVVQVALAKETFSIGQGGGTSLGIMLAVMGIGTGLGPIIGRRFTGDRDRSLRIALAISYLLGALGMAMMAPLSSFVVVLIGMVVRGIGGGIIWVFSTQLLLQLVPDRVRGRVFATEFALFTLMTAVGAAAGGWALDNTELGISGMLWLMAFLTLVPGVLWVLWNLGRRRLKPVRKDKEVAEAVISTTESSAGT